MPCIPYNHFGKWGISIFDHRRNRAIHSFPKQHIENGVEKNKRTGQMFKPLVRVFKSLRNEMIEDGVLWEGAAPSYFVECLVYNVPDRLFLPDIGKAFYRIAGWLDDNQDTMMKMKCQNGITSMFHGDACWKMKDCRDFIEAVGDYAF